MLPRCYDPTVLRVVLALVLVPVASAAIVAPLLLEKTVVPHLRRTSRLGVLDAITEQLGVLKERPARCRLFILGSSQGREAFDGRAIEAASGCETWNWSFSSGTPRNDLALLPLMLEARPTHVLLSWSAFSFSRCLEVTPDTIGVLGPRAAAAIERRSDREEILAALGPLASELGLLPRLAVLRAHFWEALVGGEPPAGPDLRPQGEEVRLVDPWIYQRVLSLEEIEAGVRAPNPLGSAFSRPDCLSPAQPREGEVQDNLQMRAFSLLHRRLSEAGVAFAAVRMPLHPATSFFIGPEHRRDLEAFVSSWPSGLLLDWTDPELTATLIDSTHVGAVGRELVTHRTAEWLEAHPPGTPRAVP